MTKPLFKLATPVLRLLLLLSMGGFSMAAESAEPLVFTLRIKDHLFIPAELLVPANTRFRLRIVNEDATAEEFESASLNREKVIMGGSEGIIHLGPLAPGEYSFFGEFNPRTAVGRLIVNETDHD
jgi:hypothetical protein